MKDIRFHDIFPYKDISENVTTDLNLDAYSFLSENMKNEIMRELAPIKELEKYDSDGIYTSYVDVITKKLNVLQEYINSMEDDTLEELVERIAFAEFYVNLLLKVNGEFSNYNFMSFVVPKAYEEATREKYLDRIRFFRKLTYLSLTLVVLILILFFAIRTVSIDTPLEIFIFLLIVWGVFGLQYAFGRFADEFISTKRRYKIGT